MEEYCNYLLQYFLTTDYLEGFIMEIVKASMAGTVWKIVVAEGDQVTAGQDVAILESMKMEIPIAAEESGVVTKIIANEGDFINLDDPILEIG